MDAIANYQPLMGYNMKMPPGLQMLTGSPKRLNIGWVGLWEPIKIEKLLDLGWLHTRSPNLQLCLQLVLLKRLHFAHSTNPLGGCLTLSIAVN